MGQPGLPRIQVQRCHGQVSDILGAARIITLSTYHFALKREEAWTIILLMVAYADSVMISLSTEKSLTYPHDLCVHTRSAFACIVAFSGRRRHLVAVTGLIFLCFLNLFSGGFCPLGWPSGRMTWSDCKRVHPMYKMIQLAYPPSRAEAAHRLGKPGLGRDRALTSGIRWPPNPAVEIISL